MEDIGNATGRLAASSEAQHEFGQKPQYENVSEFRIVGASGLSERGFLPHQSLSRTGVGS